MTLSSSMRRAATVRLLACVLAIAAGPLHAATSCPAGVALAHTIRLTPDTLPVAESSGITCSPTETVLARTGPDGIGAVGVAKGGVGAAAATGVISAKPNSLVYGTTHAETQIAFTLVKTDPGLPNFVNVQAGYAVEVVTLQSLVSVTDPGAAVLRGEGYANIFKINDAGQMIGAGGVPVEHRNGVPVSLGVGDTTPFGDDSVTIEVGRLHVASFWVTAFTQVSVGAGMPPGSAAAQLYLAIAGVITPPTGYAVEYVGAVPTIGAYPLIDDPFAALVPLPAAAAPFALGVLALGGIARRRRAQR